MQVIEAEVIRIKEENKLELSLLFHEKKENPFQVLSKIKELPDKKVPKARSIIDTKNGQRYSAKRFNLVKTILSPADFVSIFLRNGTYFLDFSVYAVGVPLGYSNDFSSLYEPPRPLFF
jgi:hypothetical protein